MKFNGLHQLSGLRETLAQRARDQALALEREQAARAAALRQKMQFANAVGPVTVLPQRAMAIADTGAPRATPEPRQTVLDEQAALREAMSDDVDIDTLLLTDDGLSYRRPGVSPDVVTRLRRGQWTITAELDLHGLRREEAREALAKFVHDAAKRGARCLRVVHGKGHGSPGKQPVLKNKAQRWLAQCAEVLAFTQAPGPDGGAGALLVLLGS